MHILRGGGRDRTVLGFTTISLQAVPITTTIMGSNPAHGEVYSIQHYMIKFVSDLRQVGGFRHDITEMLLKVTLSTITLTLALLMGNRS